MTDNEFYSLDNLASLNRKLDSLEKAFDNYSGNNPDKYRAETARVRSDIRLVSDVLKAKGDIPYSPAELLTQALDSAFPRARSKEIVEHEGARYQLKFTPLARSRSRKTVTEWGRRWIKLGGDA